MECDLVKSEEPWKGGGGRREVGLQGRCIPGRPSGPSHFSDAWSSSTSSFFLHPTSASGKMKTQIKSHSLSHQPSAIRPSEAQTSQLSSMQCTMLQLSLGFPLGCWYCHAYIGSMPPCGQTGYIPLCSQESDCE
jgi:hypothetical protein